MPFTLEEFLGIFETFNHAIFPLQIIMYVVAVGMLVISIIRTRKYDMFIPIILGLIWIFVGLTYHILSFSSINNAAFIFGIAFIVAGILLIMNSFSKQTLKFGNTINLFSIVGWIYIFYSMIMYPIWGLSFGHGYPEVPLFGVVPCPVVIFTMGIFLLSRSKIAWYLWLIPSIWSIIGGSAAIKLEITQDFGLIVAGLGGLILILIRNRKLNQNLKS